MGRLRAIGFGAALVAFALAAGVSGCATSGPAAVERLDRGTGATYARLTSVRTMFRNHSGSAAFARDVVTYAPLRVNRSGHHEHYLWLAAWSTMQDADPARDAQAFARITILADGEPLPLQGVGARPRDVHLSEPPYRPPVGNAAIVYYPVTPDQLTIIYSASRLELVSGGERHYRPWSTDGDTDDGLALAELLRTAPLDQSARLGSGSPRD